MPSWRAPDPGRLAADYRVLEAGIERLIGGGGAPRSSGAAAAGTPELETCSRRWAGRSWSELRESLSLGEIVRRMRPADTDSGVSRRLSLEFLDADRFAERAARITVHYGKVSGPFGETLIAASGEGLCHLSFPAPGTDERELLRGRLPHARLCRDPARARRWADRVFLPPDDTPLPAWLHGTPFQLDVWRALAALPAGRVESYRQLAVRSGHPGAARAVGTAMARNPLAWVVPCHRVVRQDGQLGHYQGGTARKAAMLAWEFMQG